jgi:sesquipedalian
VNKAFQRRWFVLKGNLLFYFEKRGGELLGMIILEGCTIELAENETEKYCFHIHFLGNRSYVLSADDQETLESWMRALTCSGFDYMRLMVSELQRQLDELDKTSSTSSVPDGLTSSSSSSFPPLPPRRQNPFNKFNGEYYCKFNIKAATLT